MNTMKKKRGRHTCQRKSNQC